jgi:succinate dehydrogenase / fumarate reductase membrane anchor subunit
MSSQFRDPLAEVRGLGSAKHGVKHWWMQRLTAIALLPLAIWILISLLRLLHADYPTARHFVAEPLHAVLIVAFIIAMFWHAQLGLQVVIEDYVHTRWLELSSILVVKFLCLLGALASTLAVVRIAGFTMALGT